MQLIHRMLQVAVMATIAASLFACGHKDSKDQNQATEKLVPVAKKVLTTPLIFKGTLKPIATTSVVSPIDGRVRTLNFTYGVEVKKNQELLVLSSDDLRQKFDQAVSDFLTKKESMANTKVSFQGTEVLYKAGITQKSQYLTEKSSFDTSQLGLYQAKSALIKLMNKVDLDFSQIENLKITDISKVEDSFKKRFDNIKVVSASSGVALYPIPTEQDASTNKTDGKLHVGTEVKEGQLMLSVGDLSGFQVSFDVNEVMVNSIKVGMPVTVTGYAFPGITLKGTVKTVGTQANPNQSGSSVLSEFNVDVIVPNVPKAAKNIIHVGMTCKAQIDLKSKPSLVIPIAAIHDNKKGDSTVTRVNKSGERKTVVVTTSETTPEGLAVVSTGLVLGDKVVVND